MSSQQRGPHKLTQYRANGFNEFFNEFFNHGLHALERENAGSSGLQGCSADCDFAGRDLQRHVTVSLERAVESLAGRLL